MGHPMTADTSATRNGTGMAAGPKSGPTMGDPRRFNVKGWLLWTAAFVSFPIAGIAAQAAVGRINDVVAALAGGLVAGAVIGTGQWLAGRRLRGNCGCHGHRPARRCLGGRLWHQRR
jgi:hypothetical protein